VPIYEYKCPQCRKVFEELVRTEAEAQRIACPQCGHRQVERVLSVFAAHGGTAKRPETPPGCSQCCGPGGACPLGG